MADEKRLSAELAKEEALQLAVRTPPNRSNGGHQATREKLAGGAIWLSFHGWRQCLYRSSSIGSQRPLN